MIYAYDKYIFYYSEYIFWLILVFTTVFIHEFGHYIVARINNVDIEKFSIGFGPVFSKTDKNKTIWQIGAYHWEAM